MKIKIFQGARNISFPSIFKKQKRTQITLIRIETNLKDEIKIVIKDGYFTTTIYIKFDINYAI